jgi:hypothetical protein
MWDGANVVSFLSPAAAADCVATAFNLGRLRGVRNE